MKIYVFYWKFLYNWYRIILKLRIIFWNFFFYSNWSYSFLRNRVRLSICFFYFWFNVYFFLFYNGCINDSFFSFCFFRGFCDSFFFYWFYFYFRFYNYVFLVLNYCICRDLIKFFFYLYNEWIVFCCFRSRCWIWF